MLLTPSREQVTLDPGINLVWCLEHMEGEQDTFGSEFLHMKRGMLINKLKFPSQMNLQNGYGYANEVVKVFAERLRVKDIKVIQNNEDIQQETFDFNNDKFFNIDYAKFKILKETPQAQRQAKEAEIVTFNQLPRGNLWFRNHSIMDIPKVMGSHWCIMVKIQFEYYEELNNHG